MCFCEQFGLLLKWRDKQKKHGGEKSDKGGLACGQRPRGSDRWGAVPG